MLDAAVLSTVMFFKVGCHDNFRRRPQYKILYQATGVSTGKISSQNAVFLLALPFLVSTCDYNKDS